MHLLFHREPWVPGGMHSHRSPARPRSKDRSRSREKYRSRSHDRSRSFSPKSRHRGCLVQDMTMDAELMQ